MLIVNQTKDLLVNTDRVSNIWIEKKINSIKARLDGDSDSINAVTLGIYQSLDDCKTVLNNILSDYACKELRFEMPLGGDVR